MRAKLTERTYIIFDRGSPGNFSKYQKILTQNDFIFYPLEVRFQKRGVLHREGGPAILLYNYNLPHEYYLDGSYLREKDYWKILPKYQLS